MLCYLRSPPPPLFTLLSPLATPLLPPPAPSSATQGLTRPPARPPVRPPARPRPSRNPQPFQLTHAPSRRLEPPFPHTSLSSPRPPLIHTSLTLPLFPLPSNRRVSLPLSSGLPHLPALSYLLFAITLSCLNDWEAPFITHKNNPLRCSSAERPRLPDLPAASSLRLRLNPPSSSPSHCRASSASAPSRDARAQ